MVYFKTRLRTSYLKYRPTFIIGSNTHSAYGMIGEISLSTHFRSYQNGSCLQATYKLYNAFSLK